MSAKEPLKDRDIREPLFLFLEEEYGKVRFIEEQTLGRSRADVLMVTDDALCGIEIKSDADTYQRLASQIKDYDRFCDRNYVAVGSSHAMHIEEHVPPHWGIITIDETDGAADFYILRPPAENPHCNDALKIRLLWRRELNHLLEINGLPAYRWESKPFVEKKLIEKVPSELLRQQICAELFERDYNTIEEEIQTYRKEHRRPRKRRRKVLK